MSAPTRTAAEDREVTLLLREYDENIQGLRDAEDDVRHIAEALETLGVDVDKARPQ